ncbi:hypothetical protein BDZ89DRAFT_1158448 [Hymenopellis radicata]|nr:hypothetical protein BDZ89DRAFT_1158448 [Hymenopellis radicata]
MTPSRGQCGWVKCCWRESFRCPTTTITEKWHPITLDLSSERTLSTLQDQGPRLINNPSLSSASRHITPSPSTAPKVPTFPDHRAGALKREPAMYNVVPPEQQRSRIPAPIYAQAGAPRPQIYRAAGVAAVYVVPRSVLVKEEKRVRWGSCTDRSGSGRRHHVKNVKSTYPEDATHRPTRRPRQLLKPGKRLHKDGSHPSLIPTFGSSKKVVLKGHNKWESSG